jgi:hypothetical protein
MGDVLLALALLGIAVWAFRDALDEWRGKEPPAPQPEWWRGSPGVWRAWQRTGRAATIAFGAGLLPFVLLNAVSDTTEGPVFYAKLFFIAVLSLGITLMATTALVGRPLFMVHPALRRERVTTSGAHRGN